jgi:peptidoglycan glycosyltransferase
VSAEQMNKPIRRVFHVVIALLALLAFYTARWTVFDARSLNQNTLNKIPAQKNAKKPRGAILTASGRVIARSTRRADGEYIRRYPTGELFSHPVGYSYAFYGQSGLEKYYDDQLTGRSKSVGSLLDQALGRGGDEQTMVTNLDRGAQQLAQSLMAGRKGAVVVMDPRTGQVPVYVSIPGFPPAAMGTPAGVRALNSDERNSPLVDRVSDSTYPPGSTFKVVAATAALDSGVMTTTSTVDGDSPQTFASRSLANDFNQQFGPTTLETALTYSVNTAFGNIGVKLGKQRLYEYMRRYGFFTKPPVDMPPSALLASGLRDGPDLLGVGANIDLARTAIGQERLAVTPIQMLEVAATVANGGVRMEPRLADYFRDDYGRTTLRVRPQRATRVMRPATARELNRMMRKVVEEGTGSAANVGDLKMAGKTGTAEVRGGNQAWFIGFAPYDDPQYAVAVTIEKTQDFGGVVAAPIARDVLQYLLRAR